MAELCSSILKYEPLSRHVEQECETFLTQNPRNEVVYVNGDAELKVPLYRFCESDHELNPYDDTLFIKNRRRYKKMLRRQPKERDLYSDKEEDEDLEELEDEEDDDDEDDEAEDEPDGKGYRTRGRPRRERDNPWVSPNAYIYDAVSEKFVCQLKDPKSGKKCLIGFAKKAHLDRHIKYIHTPHQKRIRCFICDEDWNSMLRLPKPIFEYLTKGDGGYRRKKNRKIDSFMRADGLRRHLKDIHKMVMPEADNVVRIARDNMNRQAKSDAMNYLPY